MIERREARYGRLCSAPERAGEYHPVRRRDAPPDRRRGRRRRPALPVPAQKPRQRLPRNAPRRAQMGRGAPLARRGRPCPHGTRQRPEAGGAHSLARPRALCRAPRLFARGRRPQVGAGRELFRASARGRAQARPALHTVRRQAPRALRGPRPARRRALSPRQPLHRPPRRAVRRGAAAHHAPDRAGGLRLGEKGPPFLDQRKRLPQRPPRARAEVPRLHGSPSARRTQALPERGEIPRRLGGHGLPRRDRRPRV